MCVGGTHSGLCLLLLCHRWMGDLNYRTDLSRIDDALHNGEIELGAAGAGDGGVFAGGAHPPEEAPAAAAGEGKGAEDPAAVPLVSADEARAVKAGKAGVLRLIERGEWTALMEADQLQVRPHTHTHTH
jgi:hypothetical protein